jgi:hypothetical protein
MCRDIYTKFNEDLFRRSSSIKVCLSCNIGITDGKKF